MADVHEACWDLCPHFGDAQEKFSRHCALEPPANLRTPCTCSAARPRFSPASTGPWFPSLGGMGKKMLQPKRKMDLLNLPTSNARKKNPHKCKCQGTHYVMKLSKSDDVVAHLCPPQFVKVFYETFHESSGGIWVCQALNSTLVATTRGESPLFCKTNLPKKGI